MEHNDNAPPSYSAPSALFKSALSFNANKNCSRCSGTGYIGAFKSIAGGRCFRCLPDELWEALLGELKGTGTDDTSGKHVCDIRHVTSDIYSSTGYIVTRAGLPPTENIPIFSTLEEALEFAKDVYGI